MMKTKRPLLIEIPRGSLPKGAASIKLEEKAHSKYSASGAERWHECPGSVHVSAGLPDKASVWSIEGSKAHVVLDNLLKDFINKGVRPRLTPNTDEMTAHGVRAANFIIGVHQREKGSELLTEARVTLDPMVERKGIFGTLDSTVIGHFATLHVMDYKYGKGHGVSAIRNLQMIFYALGVAYLYDWNFAKVRLWIIQPRVRGYDGPTYWEIDILTLKSYVKVFRKAIERVEQEPDTFKEGPWCFFCRAKQYGKCPLKNKVRLERTMLGFSDVSQIERKKRNG